MHGDSPYPLHRCSGQEVALWRTQWRSAHRPHPCGMRAARFSQAHGMKAARFSQAPRHVRRPGGGHHSPAARKETPSPSENGPAASIGRSRSGCRSTNGNESEFVAGIARDFMQQRGAPVPLAVQAEQLKNKLENRERRRDADRAQRHVSARGLPIPDHWRICDSGDIILKSNTHHTPCNLSIAPVRQDYDLPWL